MFKIVDDSTYLYLYTESIIRSHQMIRTDILKSWLKISVRMVSPNSANKNILSVN